MSPRFAGRRAVEQSRPNLKWRCGLRFIVGGRLTCQCMIQQIITPSHTADDVDGYCVIVTQTNTQNIYHCKITSDIIIGLSHTVQAKSWNKTLRSCFRQIYFYCHTVCIQKIQYVAILKPPGRTLECAVDVVFCEKQSKLQIQMSPNGLLNPLDVFMYWRIMVFQLQHLLLFYLLSWCGSRNCDWLWKAFRNVVCCLRLKAFSVTTSECGRLMRIGGFSSLKICYSFVVHSSSLGICTQESVHIFDSLNQALWRSGLLRLNGGCELWPRQLCAAGITSLTVI